MTARTIAAVIEKTRQPGRSSRSGPYLVFPDGRRVWAGDEAVVLPDWLLQDVRQTDLRRAAGRIIRHLLEVPFNAELDDEADALSISVVDIHPDDFWPIAESYRDDDFGVRSCEILADGSTVTARVVTESPLGLDEPDVRRIASSLAGEHHVKVADVESAWVTAVDQGWYLDLTSTTRGRTVGDLVAVGGLLGEVIAAPVTTEGITFEVARHLLKAGHTAWLIGFPENEWLDAKSQPWDLATEAGKVEFGQDVGRFANATGGLIVVGAATKKRNGFDRIIKAGGLPKGMLDQQRVEATVDARVYPPVEGFMVLRTSLSASNEVVTIVVPPQPDELKPFLVHGAIVDGRTEGAFFSIVRRRGEASIPTSAREVHAWLAAGRQLLTRHAPPAAVLAALEQQEDTKEKAAALRRLEADLQVDLQTSQPREGGAAIVVRNEGPARARMLGLEVTDTARTRREVSAAAGTTRSPPSFDPVSYGPYRRARCRS